MFSRLLSELESLRTAYGYEVTDALKFIKHHIEEYRETPELVSEFELFVEHGKQLLSPEM